MRTYAETQMLLDRRGKRRHKKRHSVNKERSHEERSAALLARHVCAERDRAFRAYKKQARLYWLGERDGHPEKPF